jgi:hypothetical protein
MLQQSLQLSCHLSTRCLQNQTPARDQARAEIFAQSAIVAQSGDKPQKEQQVNLKENPTNCLYHLSRT